jgi:hypothetical protein
MCMLKEIKVLESSRADTKRHNIIRTHKKKGNTVYTPLGPQLLPRFDSYCWLLCVWRHSRLHGIRACPSHHSRATHRHANYRNSQLQPGQERTQHQFMIKKSLMNLYI